MKRARTLPSTLFFFVAVALVVIATTFTSPATAEDETFEERLREQIDNTWMNVVEIEGEVFDAMWNFEIIEGDLWALMIDAMMDPEVDAMELAEIETEFLNGLDDVNGGQEWVDNGFTDAGRAKDHLCASEIHLDNGNHSGASIQFNEALRDYDLVKDTVMPVIGHRTEFATDHLDYAWYLYELAISETPEW